MKVAFRLTFFDFARVLLINTLLLNQLQIAYGFVPTAHHCLSSRHYHEYFKQQTRFDGIHVSNLSSQDTDVIFWVAAFASSHIGMSAVRSNIIQELGNLASPFINREGWNLPSWWPGDAVGKSQIFPTAETAGRQLYR